MSFVEGRWGQNWDWCVLVGGEGWGGGAGAGLEVQQFGLEKPDYTVRIVVSFWVRIPARYKDNVSIKLVSLPSPRTCRIMCV